MSQNEPTDNEELSDRLELGLGRAFGRAPSRPKRERSAEADSDRGPSPGRFLFQEEIGRGGMGVVRRAIDRTFAREVAIKELRPEASTTPEFVARFREEARISAHLQHPGVVPVYDRGEHDSTRPYFAMKFVEGETLKERLRRLRADTERRRELWAPFLRVCEAVGYAHARGVVHRDLKPANVMLGEHGEVFVMDWGLAKVLAVPGGTESPTLWPLGGDAEPLTVSGRAVGTPGYMPPEQCRGGSGLYAAWSDVWSLGAILFEILTGEALAKGRDEDGHAIIRSWTETVIALADPTIDDELRKIVLSCLEVDALKRPFDAGILARRLRAWSHHVEARARAAEIEAAESRLRVAHERRVRKLATLIASVIVISLLAGAGTWWWVEQRRSERRQAAELELDLAMKAVAHSRERAVQAPTGNAAAWRETLGLSEAAARLARLEEVSAEWRARAHATLEEIRTRVLAVEEEERRAAADREAVVGLDAIAEPSSDGRDFARNDREYEALYLAYGLNLAEQNDEQVLARVQASGIRRRLVLGFVDWSALRHRLEEREFRTFPVVSTRIFRLAGTLASEPAEKQLLDIMNSLDLPRAMTELDDAAWRRIAPAMLRTYGDTLGITNGPELAQQAFRRAARLHPGDFYLNFQLGWWAKDRGPEFAIEARTAFAAALALRPTNALVRVNLGVMARREGNNVLAEELFREAVHVDPKCGTAHYNLGVIYTFKEAHAEAIDHYRQSVLVDPSFAPALCNLGVSLLRTDAREEGVSILERAVGCDDRLLPALGQLANEWLRTEHHEAALDLLERAAAVDQKQRELNRLLTNAWIGLQGFHEAARVAEARLAELPLQLLAQKSEEEAAIEELRRRAADAERAVTSVLTSASRPDRSEDWWRCLRACRSLQRFADEARIWELWLASESGVEDEHLGDAAIAWLTSTARTPDADDQKALRWLARAVEAILVANREDPSERPNRRGRVARWLRSPAIISLRQSYLSSPSAPTPDPIFDRLDALARFPSS